jgi:hypothetical protein
LALPATISTTKGSLVQLLILKGSGAESLQPGKPVELPTSADVILFPERTRAFRKVSSKPEGTDIRWGTDTLIKAVVVQNKITSAVPVNWASLDVELGLKLVDGVGLAGDPTLIAIAAGILPLKLTS